jgi:hypothetical protein
MRSNLLKRVLVAVMAIVAMTVPAVLTAAPAQAAWGEQIPVTLQINGNNQQLGYAGGWIQFDKAAGKFRYSITVCRQSSYTLPRLQVATNAELYSWNWDGTHVTTHYMGSGSGQGPAPAPCYQGNDTFTAEHQFVPETPYSDLRNVKLTITSGTFTSAGFTEFSRGRTYR